MNGQEKKSNIILYFWKKNKPVQNVQRFLAEKLLARNKILLCLPLLKTERS